MENGYYTAQRLKEHHPSDEIILNRESVTQINTFRQKFVGNDLDKVSDVIWANTIPLKDVELSTENGMTVRVCIFDEALENLNEVPDGRIAVVGAMQEYGDKSFVIIGVTKGKERTDISLESFDKDGNTQGVVDNHEPFYEFMRIWHGIQLALLHPQIKDVIADGKIVKRYTRENTETRKRQRVVRYIKRHIVDDNRLKNAFKEYHRHCLAWYVIGHWRHYKDGRVVFIKPYWKGEMRALKRNFDCRERRIATQ